MVPTPAQRALIVAAALMTRGRLSSAKAHGRLRKIDRRAEKRTACAALLALFAALAAVGRLFGLVARFFVFGCFAARF